MIKGDKTEVIMRLLLSKDGKDCKWGIVNRFKFTISTDKKIIEVHISLN